MTRRQITTTPLVEYLAHLGLVGVDARVTPIGDGHSNVINLVDDGERRVVVRQPPPPPHPPGAHDVVREARIQAALAATAVPVPRILAVEENTEILGVPFYVMEHIDGEILTTATPAAFRTPEQRRAIAEHLIDTLAVLHSLDPVALGLAEPAAAPRDPLRTLHRLTPLLATDGGALPGPLQDMVARLAEAPPRPRPVVLTHGDFRLGNVILAARPPVRLLAVLDWELAGVGDPLADLGYLLATYARRDEPLHAMTELGRATTEPGYLDRHALVARYARATGARLDGLAWHTAAALWKLAVLFEYQRRRLLTGDGDPFYARPGLVEGLLGAAEFFLNAEEDA